MTKQKLSASISDRDRADLNLVARERVGGCHIRPANEAEVAAYMAQEVRHPCFAVDVAVGADIMVTDYRGPGIWFGGAGF